MYSPSGVGAQQPAAHFPHAEAAFASQNAPAASAAPAGAFLGMPQAAAAPPQAVAAPPQVASGAFLAMPQAAAAPPQAAAAPPQAAAAPPQAAAAPPQAAADGMFKLEVKQAGTASKFGMQGLTLGYLAQLGAFQEHWDGVYPEEFPFDPSVPNSKGKRLETFASYVGKEKGRQAILTKAKGVGGMSASVLESIVRVVSALPEGVEQAEQPINEMFGLLSSPDWHSLLDVTKCTENDRDITLLLLASTMTRDAIRRAPANGQAVHNNDVRYMDADVGIFTLLKSLSPEVSRRMERWGLQLSQLYIDFFRLLGEHVGCQVWEKKASVSEAQIRAIIWGLTLMTPVSLNYGAMSNLWVRSERT